MSFSRICVCGAGTMGSGIAQAASQAGYYTVLYDLQPAMLEKAKLSVSQNLDMLTAKGKISAEENQRILSRIQFCNDIHLCMADLIIEAVVEKTEVKTALFNQLAEINHSECIFASNTSSLSIAAIANGTRNPERVAGMHFFNPATIMKLVELVRAPQTTDSVMEAMKEFVLSLGKIPVICRDSPGFIVNRVARPYYIEALRLAEEGADMETIDTLLESAGFKMGPFKLMDLIGHDVNYAVSTSVYEQLGRPERLRPSDLQKEKLEKGELGRKTGKGFYQYKQA